MTAKTPNSFRNAALYGHLACHSSQPTYMEENGLTPFSEMRAGSTFIVQKIDRGAVIVVQAAALRSKAEETTGGTNCGSLRFYCHKRVFAYAEL